MAITGLDRISFEAVLKAKLSTTTPIRSPEFLRGRERKLEDIRRALVADGRHIFIYGDRGVGKTSLAQTAAYEHQSADQEPILLACDAGANFYGMARDLVAALMQTDPTIAKQTTARKVGFNLKSLVSGEAQVATERGGIPDMRSINEAVSIIGFAARRYAKAPVIIIDEFERIRNANDRMLFADFIKQAGDQSIPLKLIFCGVGSSLDDLLGAHHSCYRYLSAVELERLGFDGRLEIIEGARSALGVTVDDPTRYRIAIISDGFPHYVHLLCEKLFWRTFEDERILMRAEPEHFTFAIEDAVRDIQPHLKKPYEKAIRKYNDDYEEVLWAVADDKELSRRSTDIFASYQRIMSLRNGRKALDRTRFNQRMNSLKQQPHGQIIKGNRAGWYEFTENIVRGYVRIRAQEKGIELEVDHQLLARKFGPALHAAR